MAQAIVWTSPSGLLLLWLQVAILALVCHWLGRLRQRVLRSQLDVQKRAAQGLQPQGDDGADFLPTVDSLQTEIPKTKGKNAPPRPAEWAPLTEEELDVIQKLQGWCKHPQSSGTPFEEIPLDLVVSFVRGYRYRPDWPNAAFAYLDRAFRWRRAEGIDAPHPVMMRPTERLPDRAVFEKIFQCAPVGWDADGHPVLLERFCQSMPEKIFGAFSQDGLMEQLTFNRECQRAYCTAASARTGNRVFKCVVIVDLTGLCMAHTSKRMIALIRAINGLFSYHYPESLQKVYVIHAPFVFSSLWAIVKHILHPITVAKLEVCGKSPWEALQKGGVTLTGGKIPDADNLVGWHETMQRLRREMGDDNLLLNGWLPEADREAMARRGLLATGGADATADK